jgi:hypothetical protein
MIARFFSLPERDARPDPPPKLAAWVLRGSSAHKGAKRGLEVGGDAGGICPFEVAIENCEFNDIHFEGNGGGIFVNYRPVSLQISDVNFLKVTSGGQGGCIYFLGRSGNYSSIDGVNFGAAVSGGFCHLVGFASLTEVRAVAGTSGSGTVYVDLSDSSDSSTSASITRLNSSRNEAASGGSGLAMEGGSGVSLRFVRLVSNSGGVVLSRGTHRPAEEEYRCVDFSGNSGVSNSLIYVAMDVVFADCAFQNNSHPTLIDRHSSSADDVAVGFWRCVFDSGVIAAGAEIAVVSESCEFDRSGDLTLDPHYCSPFVTFPPTDGKAESGNVVVFVAAGAGGLILIVVVLVVLVVCGKGSGE